MMKFLKNSKGLSVIEVLVAAGIGTVVSLGIATMIQNTMVEQKKTQLYATLGELKKRMTTMLQDPNSWRETLNGASNSGAVYVSMRSNSAVSEIAYTSPVEIVIYDAAGNSAYDLFGTISSGTYSGSGFTLSGATCSTFSNAGSDDCPISYKLLLAADCATGTSCTNPQLKIVARLMFNPSPTGPFQKFKGMLNIRDPLNNDITDGTEGKYDVVVKRTATQINRYFRLATRVTGGSAGNCSTAGAGTCSTVASPGALHPHTATWTEVDDPYNLVSTSSYSIVFANSGTYSCTFTVPAFATGGFRATLCRATGTTCTNEIASAITTAGQWAMANAVINVKFNAVSTDQYRIFQRCDALPGGFPNADACTLGMNTSPYGTSDIVTANCFIVDTDMVDN
jgi:type II secretory pathway component PulJ